MRSRNLGLFFLLVWVVRRTQPKGNILLPTDVVQTLGRAQLTGRHQMHVVQFGGKLLLVSTASGGVETLSEISDLFAFMGMLPPQNVARRPGDDRTR